MLARARAPIVVVAVCTLVACNALIGLEGADSGGAQGSGVGGAQVTASTGSVTTKTTTTSSSTAPSEAVTSTSSTGPSSVIATADSSSNVASSTVATSSSSSMLACSADGVNTVTNDCVSFPGSGWSGTNSAALSANGSNFDWTTPGSLAGVSDAYTDGSFSLSTCALTLQIVQAPTDAQNNAYLAFTSVDMAHGLEIDVTTGNAYARTYPGPVDAGSTAFSNGSRLRIRDDGTSIHFETSPDDATWTEFASVATPDWVASGNIYFGFKTTADGLADEAILDNLNL